MPLIKQNKDGITYKHIQNGMRGSSVFPALMANTGGIIKVASRIELQPGASVGFHCHTFDEETYAIMSGEGIFEFDGGECRALPGDIFVTQMGMSHGLKNTGHTSLIFFAVAAAK